MDFRELLKVETYIDYSKIIESTNLEPLIKYKPIEAGNYQLSIQAGEFYYCSPRHTLKNLYDYENMEIAIFLDEEWINPLEDENIKLFLKYKQLISHFEDGEFSVGAYVPVDLIQSLYDYLVSL